MQRGEGFGHDTRGSGSPEAGDIGSAHRERWPLAGRSSRYDDLRAVAEARLPAKVSARCCGVPRDEARKAQGAATTDGEQSTARLISNYDGTPIDPNTYRSRTPSDTQIDALTYHKFTASICPPEFSQTVEMITREEAGLLTGKLLTLEQVGIRFGFKSERQQSAGGRVHIIDVLAWLNWAQQQFQQQLSGKQGRSVRLRLKSSPEK